MSIWHDLKYAARGLRRTPSFSLLAIVSLALGIGANTAIFSLLDALMLRKLPVDEPNRLVTLEQVLRDGSRQYNFALLDAERFEQIPQIFSAVSATTWADGYNIISGSEVDEGLARISIVTGSFFETAGVGASIGRTLGRDDDRAAGAHPVAVISEAYWQRRFHRAADVIGRTLILNGTHYDIVGVAARGFHGDWVGWPTDLWIPVAMAGQVYGETGAALPRGLRRQYKVLARLAPGVSLEQARGPAETIYRHLQNDPPPVSGVGKDARLELVSAATGYSSQRTTFAQPLTALMVAVGAVLLIACANVANLLLARHTARTREMAVRLAVGAGRGRLVRQMFAEGAVLALASGGVGLLFAAWSTSLVADLARSGPVGSVNFGAQLVDLNVDLNARMVAFTIGVCAITTVLFALVPALRASNVSLTPALTGRGSDVGRVDGPLAPRKILVVVQVALSLVLLIGSGLLIRSLLNLKSQDLGFERNRLLLAWTLPSSSGRQGPALLAFWSDVQQRLESVPGVRSASASSEGLLSGAPTGGPLARPEGVPPDNSSRLDATMTVGLHFFETVGQQMLRGRDFSAHDTPSSTPVAILNETAARQIFGSADPVGRRLTLGAGSGSFVEIAGVVRDATHNAPRARGQRTIYYPAAQNARRLRWMCVAVRSEGDPATVAARIRQELRAMDPMLPILKVDTIDEQLDAVLFQDRLLTNLCVALGLVAAILASAGLCGMLFYTVSRRTKEIGVRVALGASRATVLRMVMRETLAMLLTGMAIGLPLTMATTRLIGNRLFDVRPGDPLTVTVATVTVTTMAILAAAVPARRAARVDPMVALRCE